MRLAGVPYAVGREAATEYNESAGGVRLSWGDIPASINPFMPDGRTLIPLVEPWNGKGLGDADDKVQCMTYRLCITNHSSNRVPFAPYHSHSCSARRLQSTEIQLKTFARKLVASFVRGTLHTIQFSTCMVTTIQLHIFEFQHMHSDKNFQIIRPDHASAAEVRSDKVCAPKTNPEMRLQYPTGRMHLRKCRRSDSATACRRETVYSNRF